RVVAADGHPIAGALTFSVGAPSERVVSPEPDVVAPSVERANAVAQGVTYVGVFASAGLLIFWVFVVRREGPGDGLRKAVAAAATAGGLGAVLLVPLSAAYQQARSLSDLTDPDLWVGDLARAEVWSALLVLIGLGLALGLMRVPRAAVAGALVALGSLALVGHTRSYDPLALVVGSDLIHVAAGATWVGGLLGLLLLLPTLPGEPGAALLARFSALAAFVVALVAVTGTVMAWRILQSWGALVDTPFGRLLLVKIALVLLILTVAAWNRYRLLPAIRKLADGPARVLLVRTVRLEAVGLVVVLLLTGFLVGESPADEQAVRTAGLHDSTFTAVHDDVRVYVVIEPRVVGINNILVQVQDLAGEPFEPYDEPVLTASQGEVALGEQRLENIDSGTYEGTLVLPRPGDWTVRVTVRVSEFDSPVVDLRIPVTPREP
ncbi:MAG TPA: CopD family protein, partial [Nocardioidaceae bacterium]|nr:CopD family protein [Nocardioidaceae bacterium]